MPDSNVIAFPERTPRVVAEINAALGCETGAPMPHTLSDAGHEIVLMAVMRGIAALGRGYRLTWDDPGAGGGTYPDCLAQEKP